MSEALKQAARFLLGRYRALRPQRLRFRGAFSSYEESLAHVRPGLLAGYNHDAVAEVSKELMQQVPLWDYPILYWLQRLIPEAGRLIDAGGHIGVKYRAFAPYLDLESLDWVVFDLPAEVRAGRMQKRPQDRTLSFVDRLEDAPPADILLVSGLLPYFNGSLSDLVGRLQALPRHILLNKVVTREGSMLVTLENFGMSEVPYQIRSDAEIPASLEALGYDILDRWTIDSLGHRIQTHPELGRVTYRGYVARRRAPVLA